MTNIFKSSFLLTMMMISSVNFVHGIPLRFLKGAKPFIKELDHLGHLKKYEEHALKSQRTGLKSLFGNSFYHQKKAIAHNQAAENMENLWYPETWHLTGNRLTVQKRLRNAGVYKK